MGKDVEVKLYAPIDKVKYLEGELVAFEDGVVTIKTPKGEIKIELSKIAKINEAVKFN